MLISLSEIMNLPNIEKHFVCAYSPDKVEVSGETYRITKKDDVKVTVKNNGGRKLLIKAETDVIFTVPCSRCLKPQTVDIPVRFENEIDMKLSAEERSQNLDETEYINGYDLDVDRLVTEEILLGFPMKVLCDQACKGICSICGADLNLGECGCDRTELDPRMAVIREFYKKKQ